MFSTLLRFEPDFYLFFFWGGGGGRYLNLDWRMWTKPLIKTCTHVILHGIGTHLKKKVKVQDFSQFSVACLCDPPPTHTHTPGFGSANNCGLTVKHAVECNSI